MLCSPTRVDAVAGAGDSRDDPRLAEPFAQTRDGDTHRVGERVRVLVPRPRPELLCANDPTSSGDEHFEHCVLLPGQRDVTAVTVDLAAARVQPPTRARSPRCPV